MKKKRIFKSWLSGVLVIVFIVQLLPAHVFSVDRVNQQVVSHDFESVRTESVELRDAYTKHFRSPEGEYYAEVYAQPIHFKESGKWTEYDLSLKAAKNDSGYVAQKTDTPVYLPKKFSSGEMITVSHGGYTVGFGMSSANAGFNSKATAHIGTATTQGVSEELRYKGVMLGTDVTYNVLPNGIKENIVVNKKQSSYRYVFDMDFGGLEPVPQDDGSIYLMRSEDSKKPSFILDAPLMVDNAGNVSRDVTLSMQGNQLIVQADSKWINARKEYFP